MKRDSLNNYTFTNNSNVHIQICKQLYGTFNKPKLQNSPPSLVK